MSQREGSLGKGLKGLSRVPKGNRGQRAGSWDLGHCQPWVREGSRLNEGKQGPSVR